jgi:Flp pilus assembly protein TadG
MTMRRMGQVFRKFTRDDSGAAAVEFAMVSVAFIIMMFGLVFSGMMLFHKSTLKWAVQRASREAAVNTAITETAMQTAINSYLAGLGVPTATVTYSTGISNGIAAGMLSATFTRSYELPLVTTFTMTFTETAVIPQGS